MKPIQLISPVDGSVYAERTPLTLDAAKAAAARAKAAQKALGRAPFGRADCAGESRCRQLERQCPENRRGTGVANGPPHPLWRRIWRRERPHRLHVRNRRRYPRTANR